MQRGVFTLQKLTLFVPRSGSSEGVRQFIQTDLRQVAEKYNNVRFDVVWSKDKFLHPRVTGFYLNGRTQNIVLRNKTSRQVAELVRRLHDRTGGIVNMKRWPSAKTAVPSFQGTWNTAAFQK